MSFKSNAQYVVTNPITLTELMNFASMFSFIINISK